MDALGRLAWIAAVALASLASTGATAPTAMSAQRHPGQELTVPILMYHLIDVSTPSEPAITRRLTVRPDDFAAQMRWLSAHGYHTVTQLQLLEALEGNAPLPAKPLLITFDDGYADVFFKASTTLLRLHMHATAYVITSRISGSDPSFLTWDLLHALEARHRDRVAHRLARRPARAVRPRGRR